MNPFGPSASPHHPLRGQAGLFGRLAHPLLPIVALLVFMGCVGPAPSWGAASGQREALIASLPKGDTFKNDGQPYVWLLTLRAEKQAGGNAAPGVSRDPVAENTGELLETKGLFSIYRPVPASPASGLMTADAGESFPVYPVVLNQRTQSLGVLTRRLWLKLREMRDADEIAKEYGMTLSFSNAAMETSFYEVPEGIDLRALRARLQGDPRIVRVTLEVIDRIYRPR